MKLAHRHQPLIFIALAVLLCGFPQRCFALYSVGELSKGRARELGITVSARPSANDDLWVQVEFKATGALKGFNWADLELRQGGKRLVTSALLPGKPAGNSPEESKLLQFYIDPAALPNATVTLFVHEGRGGVGYQLRMKDFLKQTASR